MQRPVLVVYSVFTCAYFVTACVWIPSLVSRRVSHFCINEEFSTKQQQYCAYSIFFVNIWLFLSSAGICIFLRCAYSEVNDGYIFFWHDVSYPVVVLEAGVRRWACQSRRSSLVGWLVGVAEEEWEEGSNNHRGRRKLYSIYIFFYRSEHAPVPSFNVVVAFSLNIMQSKLIQPGIRPSAYLPAP